MGASYDQGVPVQLQRARLSKPQPLQWLKAMPRNAQLSRRRRKATPALRRNNDLECLYCFDKVELSNKRTRGWRVKHGPHPLL